MRAVIGLLFSIMIGAGNAQNWAQLPDFPGTARDDGAGFTYQCYAYVGTGMQVGWSLTNDWWRFDMTDETWEQANALPAEPRQYCSAVVGGSTGYLFGGVTSAGPTNELWALDLFDGTWTQLPSLPGEGRFAAGAFGGPNTLYVVGGILPDGTATNELWKFENGTWTQKTSLPDVGRHRATVFSAAVAGYSFGYVLGGADADYNALDQVWKYDIALDTWSTLNAMPEPRYASSAVRVANTCQLLGGVDASGAIRADGWCYIPATDTWQALLPAFIAPRKGAVLLQTVPCAGVPWYAYFGLGFDGTDRQRDWYRTSFMVGLKDEEKPVFAVHPNPASSTLAIELPTGWTNPSLELCDMNGRVLRSMIGRIGSIDISMLAPSAYVLRIREASTTLSTRFIKLP